MPTQVSQDRADPHGVTGVILCGGRGTRLGGEDKASLTYAHKTFLERSVEALAGCAPIVAVGEERPASPALVWTTESPAYGGPAAGLLAGLLVAREAAPTPPTWVVALAVDMPLVTAETVRRLLASRADDGAVLVDRTGRRQQLCAVYRVAALLGNAPEDISGLPFHRLLSGLRLAEVAEIGSESSDVDVDEDLDGLGGGRPPDRD